MRYWRLKDTNCSFIRLSDVVSVSRDDNNNVLTIVYESGKDVSYFYPEMKLPAFKRECAELESELEKVGK